MLNKSHIVLSLAACTLAAKCLAWEPTTHVYFAELAINEALNSSDHKVTIYATDYLSGKILRDSAGNRIIFGRYEVNPDILRAIQNHRQTYIAGVCGPDAFPDMMTGQEMIHPAGKITPFQNRVIGGPDSDMPDINQDLPNGNQGPGANKWLTHLYNCAFVTAPNGSKLYQTDENKAFVAGFLAHAAGDMFGHTFVNNFTGAPFNFRINGGFSGNAVKHVLTEQYVLSKTPALLDVNDYDIKLDGSVPTFIYDNMIRGDSQWYLKNTNLLEGAGLSKTLSVPYQYSSLKDTLQKLLDDEAAGRLSTGKQAMFTFNPLLKPYIKAWIHDIDEGLKALPDVSKELVKALTMHPRAGVDQGGVSPGEVDDILSRYAANHLLSMSGLPDVVGFAVDGVLDAKALCKKLRGVVMELTGLAELEQWIDKVELAAMNKISMAMTGKSWTEWKGYIKSPATYFDTIDNSGTYNQDGGQLMNRASFDQLLHLDHDKLDWENFPAGFNSVQMIKLTLLSYNGYRSLMSDLESSTPITDNILLGFMETLDGSNQWKANSNKMPLASNPAWYRTMFMKQPGEIPYPDLAGISLTPGKATTFNTVKGIVSLPGSATEDTYINLFAKPVSGDMSATMTLPGYYYIPRGQNSIDFTEIMPGVKQPTTFEISAICGNSKVGTFLVNPPSLSDFAMLSEVDHSTGGSQITLSSPTISKVSLYLDSCAPTGGLKVDLTSSDPTVISVPASVTFNPGQSVGTISPQKGANFKAGSSVKLTAHYAGFTDVTKTLDFEYTVGFSVKVLGSVRSSKESLRVNPSASRLGQIQNRQNVSNFGNIASTGSKFIRN